MSGKFYDNRELSWLKFNARVLEEAFDEETPLFERLRFVQIFCSNLDEFFMIRVGSLHDKMLFDSKDTENKTNMTAKEQLVEIAKRVKQLLPVKDDAYSAIMDGLKNYGVEHLAVKDLSPEEDAYFRAFFTREIQSLLFTGVVDKKHPAVPQERRDIRRRSDTQKGRRSAQGNVRDTSRVGEFSEAGVAPGNGKVPAYRGAYQPLR